MGKVRSALDILAGEAWRRGTTYGKLVAGTTEEELGQIVHLAQLKDKLKDKRERRGENCGQREEISDEQGIESGG